MSYPRNYFSTVLSILSKLQYSVTDHNMVIGLILTISIFFFFFFFFCLSGVLVIVRLENRHTICQVKHLKVSVKIKTNDDSIAHICIRLTLLTQNLYSMKCSQYLFLLMHCVPGFFSLLFLRMERWTL